MNLEQKRQLAKDLVTGRKKPEELLQPGGIVIVQHEDGFKCLDGDASPELCDKKLFQIRDTFGLRVVSWNELQKIRGEGQGLLFLPEREEE